MESERERKQVSNKSTRFHASKMIDARGRCTGGNTSRDISFDRSQVCRPVAALTDFATISRCHKSRAHDSSSRCASRPEVPLASCRASRKFSSHSCRNPRQGRPDSQWSRARPRLVPTTAPQSGVRTRPRAYPVHDKESPAAQATDPGSARLDDVDVVGSDGQTDV